MSDAPESTAVITPPTAPPAPAPATVEHISALHRHLNELCAFVGKGFKELAALVEKAGPVVETAAAAVAGAVPSLAPVAAVGEKVLGVVERGRRRTLQSPERARGGLHLREAGRHWSVTVPVEGAFAKNTTQFASG